MIIELIISVFFLIGLAFLSLFNVFPDVPPSIVSATTAISDFVLSGIGFIYEVLGETLTKALLTVTFSLIGFLLFKRIGLFILRLIKGWL